VIDSQNTLCFVGTSLHVVTAQSRERERERERERWSFSRFPIVS